MTSGPSIPRKDRVSKGVEVYLLDEERKALEEHCETTKETRSAVVRRAVRKELGLPEPKGGCMIEWSRFDDDRIRCALISEMRTRRDSEKAESERIRKVVTNWTPAEVEQIARGHARRAAHYQQAIDLLTAAPMPEVKP
jgi:hypothetical protein